MPLLFVYGTLKRGFRLHHYLKEAPFLGAAVTAPGYALYRLDWYPALVEEPGAGSITGEVYEVCNALLEALDEVEGVPYLYRRAEIELLSLGGRIVRERCVTYLYQRSVQGRARIPQGEW